MSEGDNNPAETNDTKTEAEKFKEIANDFFKSKFENLNQTWTFAPDLFPQIPVKIRQSLINIISFQLFHKLKLLWIEFVK